MPLQVQDQVSDPNSSSLRSDCLVALQDERLRGKISTYGMGHHLLHLEISALC